MDFKVRVWLAGNHTALAVVACAVMLVSAVNSASATERADVERAAGLASFDLAAKRPQRALARVSGMQGGSAAWLEAQALLSTGQVKEAKALLTRQLEGQYHRGEAALLLGQLALEENNSPRALDHFTTAARLGAGETRQQALYQLAAAELNAGNRDRAGQVLAGMDPGYWAALGYMNLAAEFSGRDLNAARPLVALRVALAMSEQDTVSERSVALRSRLLVRAGYLSYQQEDYEKAIGFLEQVPLDSYHTPRALYLHGLALAARDNHRSAMQSWHRAKKYPLAYPGVEDAWLGMGRGYDLSGYLGQAGEAYLAANASYESERVTLRALASRIREQGAWKALIEDARDSDAQWFLADSRTLTQPRMAYLLRFMEAGEAQRAVRRVSELVELEVSLAEKAQNLGVFLDSLHARRSTSTASAAATGQALGDKAEALRARLRLLASQRGSAGTAVLAGIAQTLSDVESSLSTLKSRLANRNTHLDALIQQAGSALSEVKSLRSRSATLRNQAESILDEVALAFVAGEDERMVFALDKTEQQIAHLYEYLALESLERGAP